MNPAMQDARVSPDDARTNPGGAGAPEAQGVDVATAPSVIGVVARVLAGRKALFAQIAGAAALANLLALGSSLYAMQVYDRVMPTHGHETLLVLTVGVVMATLFELLLRTLRSLLLERAGIEVDHELSGTVFGRLLAVRLEALPGNSGVLSSHLRSMDQVRQFAVAAVLFAAFDAPFALLFVVAIGAIGGPTLAAVPLAFLAFGLVTGLLAQRSIVGKSRRGFNAQTARNGLLVETIGALESLRASSSTAERRARWDQVSLTAAESDAAVKRSVEAMQLMTGWCGQLSYVLLVAAGALAVVRDQQLTVGALVACSILGGRVLAPINALPGLLAQLGYARVAMGALRSFFALPLEGHGTATPLRPVQWRAAWRLQDVRYLHPGQARGLSVPDLTIAAGDRVGVLGPIGCGKTTLLRLLAGHHVPTEGQVLVDGLCLDQVDPALRQQALTYMPQDLRLVEGSLRSNLCAGLDEPPPSQRIVDAMKATGLADVVARHPFGLDMPLAEGGRGLSAGQRQLAGLTRLLLRPAAAWILDEPSASMDDQTEARCIQAIRAALRPGQTLVVATHRGAWLALVDRLIVMTPNGGLVVGPRDEVLARLRAGAPDRSTRSTHERTDASVG